LKLQEKLKKGSSALAFFIEVAISQIFPLLNFGKVMKSYLNLN